MHGIVTLKLTVAELAWKYWLVFSIVALFTYIHFWPMCSGSRLNGHLSGWESPAGVVLLSIGLFGAYRGHRITLLVDVILNL